MKASLSVLACQRCGTALDLPDDPRLLHVECRYCGTDNILPAALIEARRRQYELESAERAVAARAAADRAAARTRVWAWMITLGVVLAVLGAVAVLIVLALRSAAEDRARAADPQRNGQAVLLARLEELRRVRSCDRILVQPRVHAPSHEAEVSLNLVAGDHCVHVLGASGSGAALTLRYRTVNLTLKEPLPPAAPLLDYRLCASATANHGFSIATSDDFPFATAAIECPRTAAEGAARSKADDPASNGVTVARARLDALYKAGCSYVVTQPQVLRGEQTLTFTSKANGACLNVLLASAFPDVKLTTRLVGPEDTLLPVPPPGPDVRVLYCPRQEGKYVLTVTPSTYDHFAQAAIDCPPKGPEGLRREAELRKPR